MSPIASSETAAPLHGALASRICSPEREAVGPSCRTPTRTSCRAKRARTNGLERLDGFVLRGAQAPRCAALALRRSPPHNQARALSDPVASVSAANHYFVVFSHRCHCRTSSIGTALPACEMKTATGEDGPAWTLPPAPSTREDGRKSLRGRENRAGAMRTGVNIDGTCSTMRVFFLVIRTA